MKDSILILSGGVDSVTMLYDYQDRIAMALSFDYGSNHNQRELPFAALHCKRLGIAHRVVRLDFMSQILNSSLLEGAEAVPEGNYAEKNMRSTVVPFRNGVMLSVAVAMAENEGLSHVMMANHGGDHSVYPDCRPDFVDAFSRAAEAGTYAKVTLVAPYTNWTKTQIVARGKQLGIDYAETWSCYKGLEYHCGRCATCLERRQALADAGVEDNTVYLSE